MKNATTTRLPMKTLLIAAIVIAAIAPQAFSQNGVAINSGATPADASSMLDVSSTSKGALLPRMTAAQRTGIASPAIGLTVYQTDAPEGYYYNSSAGWIKLSTTTGTVTGTGAATRVAFWNGTNGLSSSVDLYWDNTNNRLGIGTTTPIDKLEVAGGIHASGAASSFKPSEIYMHYFSGMGSLDIIGPNNTTNGQFLVRSFRADGSNLQTILCADVNSNVGIGTTTPSALLDVNGSTRLRGLTAGYVKSDGSGNLSNSATVPTTDLSGTISNGQLANSSITVNAGTGLSGGGAVSLGGSTTLTNSGVLSVSGTAPILSSGGQNPTISLGSLGQATIHLASTIAATIPIGGSTATPVDIPGLTFTFTLTTGMFVATSCNLPLTETTGTLGAWANCWGSVTVDGVVNILGGVAPTLYSSSHFLNTQTIPLYYTAFLPAGTHTVKIAVANIATGTGASAVSTGGAGLATNYMDVTIIRP